jgi:uncharacterized membrane protein
MTKTLAAFAATAFVMIALDRQTALSAALLGFFAYATYDLSNLATPRGWPVGLSLLDMAWGSTVSAASAVAGKAALDPLARA